MLYILIVEDEVVIVDILFYVLQVEGFVIIWVIFVGEVLVLQECQLVDLLIFDVGLLDISGFEVCKCLWWFFEVLVIFFIVCDVEIDCVVGLEIGVDDYVVKLFSLCEVVVWVKVIFKCMVLCLVVLEEVVLSGLFQVDEECVWIYYCDILFNFICYEFCLLQMLFGQFEWVFSCEQLFDVFGVVSEVGYECNIDSYIKSLCVKLCQVNECGEVIQIYCGLGYSYSLDYV